MPTVTIGPASTQDDKSLGSVDTVSYPPSATPTYFTGGSTVGARKKGSSSYQVHECLLAYDSGSVLPDGATINSAKLVAVCDVNVYPLAGPLPACMSYFPWTGTDVGEFAGHNVGSGIRDDAVTLFDLSVVVPQTGFEIPFDDVSGISTTGITKMTLHRVGHPGTDDHNFSFGAYGNTTLTPWYVEIDYSQPYRDEVLADSPVFYGRLGEASGTTANDETANNNDGTYQNAPTLGVAGAILDGDTAVTFNGTNQLVTLPDLSVSEDKGFALECWFKSTSAATDRYLISEASTLSSNPIVALILHAGQLRGFFRDDAGGLANIFSVSTTANDDQWHHGVFESDGSSVYLYLDAATPVTSVIPAGALTLNTSSIAALIRSTIGQYYPGTIDEVAIYPAPLGAARVQAHYEAASFVETTRLAPDAIILQTNLTGVVASIQDDPEAPDANWLTTSDPSGQSSLTDGPRSPNANAAVSGFSGSFTNPANAYDGNTNTAATTTMGSNGQNHGGYFSFSSTAFAAIPSNAVIDSITVHANQHVGNSNRADQFFQLGTANGSLIGNEVQLDATNVQTVDNVTGFTTMPTRAQLVSGTFGIRVRAVKDGNTTYSLYELTATVTYSIPAQTKNTEVRVSFPSPPKNLKTG